MAVFVLCALLALLSLSSCRTIASPEGSGAIEGRVALFDTSRAAIADFSGVTVSIDGTTRSTVTDASGFWKINDVPNGQWDVTASKPGFGTFHWYEQSVNGGTLDLLTAGIAEMPNTSCHLASATISDGLYVTIVKDTAGYGRYCVYCDIDSNVPPSGSHLFVDQAWNFAPGDVNDRIPLNNIRASGALPGQKLYVSASSAFLNLDEISYYNPSFFDPKHNQTRWASTGPKSNVIAVIMP